MFERYVQEGRAISFNLPYPAGFQEIIELARAGRTPGLSCGLGSTAHSIATWIAQDARDQGKPQPGKKGLTSAER
ncbi:MULTISPECIES: hypothetical protein [Ramlibacter]|uniref:Transposase n=1 Tax=Ramlibacter aquaticus TaxID=2780094 RepID=A0ABR9SKA2_9BURK|nr:MULTISPECIES: hypothetical protein [Ramlibacter]MBE7942753.1 hypothetical protein [Ramlibacter aquaticus]